MFMFFQQCATISYHQYRSAETPSEFGLFLPFTTPATSRYLYVLGNKSALLGF